MAGAGPGTGVTSVSVTGSTVRAGSECAPLMPYTVWLAYYTASLSLHSVAGQADYTASLSLHSVAGQLHR